MKHLTITSAIIFIFLFFCSCGKDRDNNQLNCGKQTIISADEYKNAPEDPLTVTQIEIKEHCLTINFASSGCDGESWEVKLIDSEKILYSLPPQRNLRLSLKNEEECTAVIGKEMTFDLSELQLGSNGQLILNIVNAGDDILYEY